MANQVLVRGRICALLGFFGTLGLIWGLLFFATRRFTWPQVYEHLFLIAPVLVALVVAFGLALRSWGDSLPSDELPETGGWWQYVKWGSGVGLIIGSAFPLFLVALIALPVLVPYKIVDRLLGSEPSLATVLTAIPVVVGCVGVTLTLVILAATATNQGWLVGDDGKPLAKPEASIRDTSYILYFSCLAFLGSGFGEYKPVGYCRGIVLVAVVVGRVLEVVVVGMAVNALGTIFAR